MRTNVIFALTAVLFVPSALFAADDTFSCFDQFTGPVLKKFTGDQGQAGFELFEWSQNDVRMDARGATFHQEYRSDGTALNKYVVIVGGGWEREPSPAMCWVGGRFIGSTALSATYRETKNIGGAGLTMNSNGGVIDGVRMYNIHEDPLRHVSGNHSSERPHKTKVLKDSWISRTNASAIENDHIANLTIVDTLMEGSMNSLSYDPGGLSGGNPAMAKNVITIKDSLFHIREMPNSQVTANITIDYGVWLKPQDATTAAKLRVHNTIFAVDGWENSEGQSGRQKNAWAKIDDCSNNVIAWMTDKPFPPPTWPVPPSNCFKIVKGKEARDLWEAARQNWINCHPKVARVSGDPASDFSKCDTNAYGGGGSGTPTGGGTTGSTAGGGTTSGTPVTGLCNLFSNGQTPSEGYGAAWNPFNTSQGLLLNSQCETSSVRLHVGIGDFQTQYVYKQGYVHRGSWQPFTLSGNFISGSTDWLRGQGSYTLENPPPGNTFWVGYLCHWNANISQWKCGCRDAACTTNYWQLQGIKR